jgi:hypothetical protein
MFILERTLNATVKTAGLHLYAPARLSAKVLRGLNHLRTQQDEFIHVG